MSDRIRRINRRRFLQTSSGLLGLSAAGTLAGCAGGDQGEGMPAGDTTGTGGGATAVDAPWKYAICNEIMQDWDWQRQCSYAAQVGYTGLEVAPFTLSEHADDLSKDRRAELRGIAEEAGLEILGLHWLLVTPEGLHVTTPDEQLRRESWDYMVTLAELCADLGGSVMIFGSPNQRSSEGISTEEAVANMTEGLRRVAPAIGEHDVQLLLEPLSSDQTDVINTLEDAVSVVRDVDHPAVSAMFDFHNTADETRPLPELVHEYYPYIQHIQIQEMDGTYLGTGDAVTAFVPAMQAFHEEGYDRWVSLEVFDFEPGAETIASESFTTLQQMSAAALRQA